MKDVNAVIFHGWGSSSQDNWFPWLKKELEKKGIKTVCPDLPDSDHPNQKRWLDTAKKLDITENTILVGHSLGCLLIMRLIESGVKYKAGFLVSAFDKNPGITEIESFFETPFNYTKIRLSKNIILNSDNDPYIPLAVAKDLSKKIQSKLDVFHNKGHLSGGTGNLEFPKLLEMIMNELH